MERPAVRIERDGGTLTCYLHGRLDKSRVAPAWREITRTVGRSGCRRLILDLGDVSGIDSAGVGLLRQARKLCDRRRIACEKRRLPETIEEFLDYLETLSPETAEMPTFSLPGPVVHTGNRTLALLAGMRHLAEFTGNLLLAAGWVLRRPRRLRGREILFHLQKSGAEAMLFVSSLAALMGFIMGLQATVTLTQFGAGIRIADVVAIGTVKEMGPLLTAIIIAGRSGAAFAAEIGTMKIRQEIDALRVMGFDPLNFLVIPRVFALALAGPLLTLIADAAGILGGAAIAYMILDLTFLNYMVEVGLTLNKSILLQGLIKSAGFAILLGINGCYHGLHTGSAAEDVGIRTTGAVVTGILLIVLADALFSGIFHVYRI